VGPEAPDAALPNGNTAEGDGALSGLTGGFYNSAFGFLSLLSNADASFNTGAGAGTLLSNTADENTATGAGALLSNTIGENNTANGTFALFTNTEGSSNTATGDSALFSNTTGSFNTASGQSALFINTTGNANTAIGASALLSNTTGSGNTVIGDLALEHNTTGSSNVALGFSAGINQTTGSDNIYIGFNMGTAGESDACYIASIFGQTSSAGIPVLINSNNKLGTTTSSKRFKEDIKAMGAVSEALFSLQPVTFHYKKEIDPASTSQLGLVAEDVEKVNPDLVVRDKEGKAYSVRYDQVNAMLLNEFLKEHRAFVEEQRKVTQQQKEIDVLKRDLKEQRALIQKVSERIDLNRPVPRVAVNEE